MTRPAAPTPAAAGVEGVQERERRQRHWPKPGMSEAKQFASDLGLGGPMATISKFATPAAGVATAALAVFSATSRTRRRGPRNPHGIGQAWHYHKILPGPCLELREAGLSLGEVTAGMEKVHSKAAEAMTGDVSAQAYFAGLGLTTQQLQATSGDMGKLAQTVAQRGSGAQQMMGFGSIEAGRAACKPLPPWVSTRPTTKPLKRRT